MREGAEKAKDRDLDENMKIFKQFCFPGQYKGKQQSLLKNLFNNHS